MKANQKFLSAILSVFIMVTAIMPFLTVVKVNAANIFSPGDINGDSVIGVDDALCALRFSAGIDTPDEKEKEMADLDFNGTISTADAKKLLRIAAGIEPELKLEFSDWYIQTPATCQQEGVETCYCEEYGVTRTRTIPLAKHKLTGIKCENCGIDAYKTTELSIRGSNIRFGDDYNTVISKLGKPIETYAERTPDDTTFSKYLIYHNQYEDFTVITCHPTDGVISVYTFDKNVSIRFLDGSNLVFDQISNYRSKDNVHFQVFYDKELETPAPYACYYAAGSLSVNNLHAKSELNTNQFLLIELINATRKAHNVSRLYYNSEVERVARNHSNDMATNNYFDHINLRGQNVLSRLRGAGLSFTRCGENILRGGYTNPFVMHDAWYNSPTHRTVMLNRFYNEVGIGICFSSTDPSYTVYATQNFIN